MERRNRLNIIYDILKVIKAKGEIKKTHIMYQANLAHNQMKGYLNELYEKGFIENTGGKRPLIGITKKGADFFQKYAQVREFEKTFGL
ncbi:MAG: winged helix-turn-helix domain-containing protein [Nanoarchaeota archaeon]